MNRYLLLLVLLSFISCRDSLSIEQKLWQEKNMSLRAIAASNPKFATFFSRTLGEATRFFVLSTKASSKKEKVKLLKKANSLLENQFVMKAPALKHRIDKIIESLEKDAKKKTTIRLNYKPKKLLARLEKARDDLFENFVTIQEAIVAIKKSQKQLEKVEEIISIVKSETNLP